MFLVFLGLLNKYVISITTGVVATLGSKNCEPNTAPWIKCTSCLI